MIFQPSSAPTSPDFPQSTAAVATAFSSFLNLVSPQLSPSSPNLLSSISSPEFRPISPGVLQPSQLPCGPSFPQPSSASPNLPQLSPISPNLFHFSQLLSHTKFQVYLIPVFSQRCGLQTLSNFVFEATAIIKITHILYFLPCHTIICALQSVRAYTRYR